MNILRHIVRQPFIAATGLAALIHSTWSLGTLFAGAQPQGDPVHLAGWIIPAFLIAFALDIGQIVTSAEIRSQGLTRNRGITFAVFAIATYYLQFLYIVHHMPALDAAPGLRAEWTPALTLMRDAAVYILPGLLPASTLLYTLSSTESERKTPEAGHETPEAPSAVLIQKELYTPALLSSPDKKQITATCQACGWSSTYSTPRSAKAALSGHRAHCPALAEVSK